MNDIRDSFLVTTVLYGSIILFLLIGCCGKDTVVKPEYIHMTIPETPAPIEYLSVNDWFIKETDYCLDMDSSLTLMSNVAECQSRVAELEIILNNLREVK